jgi:hypothetical protein
MEHSKIKPCKCGGKAILMNFENKYYAIECLDCWFYSGRKFKTEQAAIKYWNDGAQNGYELLRRMEN